MSPEDLRKVLYALDNISDHIEAYTAYVEFAAQFPELRQDIKKAYYTDQVDWADEADQSHFDESVDAHIKWNIENSIPT